MHISHPNDANLSLVLRVWPEKMRCYYCEYLMFLFNFAGPESSVQCRLCLLSRSLGGSKGGHGPAWRAENQDRCDHLIWSQEILRVLQNDDCANTNLC